MKRALESYCGREFLVRIQALPGSDVSDDRDHYPKENQARKNSQENRDSISAFAKFWICLLRTLSYCFKSAQEPRHDLPYQQNGDERSLAEQRTEIFDLPVLRACQRENRDESQKNERHEF